MFRASSYGISASELVTFLWTLLDTAHADVASSVGILIIAWMLEFTPNALNSLLYAEESVAIGVGIISRYIEKLPVAEQSSLL